MSLKGYSVRSLLFATALAAVAMLFISRYVYVKRNAGLATVCAGRLTILAMSLHSYSEQCGCLPPSVIREANRPPRSWRVHLLPYMGGPRAELYSRYNLDEPWDGPNNRRLMLERPDFFGCPADANGRARGEANYFFVTGDDAVFDGKRTISIRGLGAARHFTVLLVEACGTGINWLEPRDLELDSLDDAIGEPTGNNVSSMHLGGANIITASPQIYFLRSEPPLAGLSDLFKPDNPRKRALLDRFRIR